MKFLSPTTRSTFGRRPQHGGVLLTALIFAALIAITLTGMLKLSQSASRNSLRATFLTAAQDLSESGLEEGLWALNSAAGGNASAWNGWTLSGSNATRKFSNFTLSNGANGVVNVLVQNYNSSPPLLISRSIITLPDGTRLEKWLRITTSTRSLFAYGLLARDRITLSGGGWADSWVSDPDNNPSTPAVPWSIGVAQDNARLATVSTNLPSISIGSGDIYGKVSVGAASSSGLAMSWGGQVGPRGMPLSGPYNLASGALSTGFSATFEEVVAPTGATARTPYQLPRSVSGPPWYLAAETIGTAGTSTILQLDQMVINGAAVLTIQGDVTLILPPPGIETLIVEGSGRIVLAPGAKLKVYTPGNIRISGAGITNPSAPESMQIWSTRNGSFGQTISLQGSGVLNAVVYAPDADLTLPGSTDFAGAAIVKSATLTGSGAFHYDESLKNFGSGGSLQISEYRELTSPAERSPYTATLSF